MTNRCVRSGTGLGAGSRMPCCSIGSALANSDGKPGATFPIDYSIQVESIPAFSALDVLNGRVSGKQLAGKDVVVGTGSEILNDNFYVPGYGRAFGVQVHALGAE